MKASFTRIVLFLALVLFAGGYVQATPAWADPKTGKEQATLNADPPSGPEPGGTVPSGPQVLFDPAPQPKADEPGFWERVWFGIKTAFGFGIPEAAEAGIEVIEFAEKETPYREALAENLKDGADAKATLDRLLEAQAARERR